MIHALRGGIVRKEVLDLDLPAILSFIRVSKEKLKHCIEHVFESMDGIMILHPAGSAI